MKVICFDRDHTVSTNPKPGRESVPLSWVKALRDDDDTFVWATGNQHLRKEANIPGLDEAREIFEMMGNGEFDYKKRHPQAYKPARREILRLIQDIHEFMYDVDIEYIVVDDVNLRDMEKDGWTHYYPWDFVEVVEGGEFHIPEINEYTDIPENRKDE